MVGTYKKVLKKTQQLKNEEEEKSNLNEILDRRAIGCNENHYVKVDHFDYLYPPPMYSSAPTLEEILAHEETPRPPTRSCSISDTTAAQSLQTSQLYPALSWQNLTLDLDTSRTVVHCPHKSNACVPRASGSKGQHRRPRPSEYPAPPRPPRPTVVVTQMEQEIVRPAFVHRWFLREPPILIVRTAKLRVPLEQASRFRAMTYRQLARMPHVMLSDKHTLFDERDFKLSR